MVSNTFPTDTIFIPSGSNAYLAAFLCRACRVVIINDNWDQIDSKRCSDTERQGKQQVMGGRSDPPKTRPTFSITATDCFYGTRNASHAQLT